MGGQLDAVNGNDSVFPVSFFLQLSSPSMLKYVLPASPERGPLGWTVRLLEATTSTPACVGTTRKLARS